MKRYSLFLFLIILLFSCGEGSNTAVSEPTVKAKVNKPEAEVIETHIPQPCDYKPDEKTSRNTFPFSKATEIVLMSYSTTWNHDMKPLHKGKLVMDSIIKERIPLNEVQRDTLFSILFNRFSTNISTNQQSVANRCKFSPLHGIAFYQGKRAIAYIELDFRCAKMNDGGTKIRFNSYGCPGGNWCLLNRFFYDVGIRDNMESHNCW